MKSPPVRYVDSIRLGAWHQGAVYGASVALLLSGAVWLLLHYFFQQEGEFGPTNHPLEVWMLRLHGAAAMLGMMVYGSLLPVHIRRAWSVRRNVYLGITLAAVVLLLTITGYLLYYAGGEQTRPVISALHWIIGLAAPLLMLWHVLSGRAQTRALPQGQAQAAR